ncbi:AraC family transcriptional regulator N-terminal domain-containing protein [Roseateles sp.]|uniref:AraC family transcriptional regulator n=1 Tax=Roseateles sp. TaxID=1971397 RepID=UPI003BAA1353
MTVQPVLPDDRSRDAALHELRDLVRRHATESITEALPGVLLLRADAPTAATPVVYEPMLCVMAQGAKRVTLGNRVLVYGEATSMIVTLAMPVTGAVVQASADRPYLAVGFRLDPAALAELLLALPPQAATTDVALEVLPVEGDLLDAAVRVLRLLDRPADQPVLGPLVARELLYRLLNGPHAPALRGLVQGRGRSALVARAVAWIRRHHDQPLRIAELAAQAALSESAFHRSFKAVTGMSPLQYQKAIRLQEARRRLLAGGGDAASVGFSVGYGSPSQFSREYARLFGQPPARDAALLRAANAPATPY